MYVDDKLESFCIGNYYEQEDMVYLPVEKANPEIRGLYQYICSQFLIEAFPLAGKENMLEVIMVKFGVLLICG